MYLMKNHLPLFAAILIWANLAFCTGNHLFLECLSGLWLIVISAKTTDSLHIHLYLAGLIGHIENHMKVYLKLSGPIRHMSSLTTCSLTTFIWCEKIKIAYQKCFCAILAQILLLNSPRNRKVWWRNMYEET